MLTPAEVVLQTAYTEPLTQRQLQNILGVGIDAMHRFLHSVDDKFQVGRSWRIRVKWMPPDYQMRIVAEKCGSVKAVPMGEIELPNLSRAELLTPHELAVALRLTEQDVDAMASTGEIPFVRVSDNIRFDFDEVFNHLKGQDEITNTTAPGDLD